MNSAVDRRELIFKALAGLAGGAIGWIPVELASHGHTITESESSWTLVGGFVSMSILAGLIGGAILAAEGKTLELTRTVKRNFLIGFVVCAILAIPENYYSDLAFTAILSAGGWGVGQPGSMLYLFLGRLVGWTLMGLMLGVGVGLASLSPKNIVKGAAGGWVGGFVGGMSFDLVGALSNTGLFSRLIGLSLIGLMIGLFIGLVQELTKSAWLVSEAGRIKGRQFRLEGTAAMIGRAEENAVGLFGDPGVQPRHAVIERRATGYALKNLAVQEGTFVNGQRIETAELHDGDRIRIGNYELSFHERQGAQAARLATQRASMRAAEPMRTTLQPSSGAVATTGAGAAASAGAAESSRAASATVAASANGPCLLGASGERFPLRVGAATTLGRAVDNDIVVNHASVSRHHATIDAVNGTFRLRDLGSQNGTYVGAERVTEASIAEGDQVKLGDAAFTFHA
jgi:pSer/pThr/pTyr-binding forkhead associated (FHA) protein